MDANLHHDLATGKAITVILHLVNSTPINWYPKKQARVVSATYGSEFVAARTVVNQIIDLRVPLHIWVFQSDLKASCLGTKSVVTSSMIPRWVPVER